MYIKKITWQNFRNLKPANVDISQSRIVGFWGDNGQGKSNILEAICVAMSGQSFRPYAKKEDWFPTNKAEKIIGPIALSLCTDRGIDYDLRIFSGNHDLGPTKSNTIQLLYNGKKTSFHHLRRLVPLVAFSPDDHTLIRHSPEARRNFMDRVFGDVVPGYYELLKRFEEALSQRNRLIRAHQKEGQLRPSAELRSFTELYAHAAHDLAAIRIEIWPDFARRYQQAIFRLLPQQRGENSIKMESAMAKDSACVTTEHIKKLLEEGQLKDLATGWTHIGPHRDDFKMLCQGEDGRSKASQGQARLLALALKWTHAEWVTEERRERPIFVIDDLSSELDATHRRQLLNQIADLSCQLIISGTNPSLVDFKAISDYTQYRVIHGEVGPLGD